MTLRSLHTWATIANLATGIALAAHWIPPTGSRYAAALVAMMTLTVIAVYSAARDPAAPPK
jgi:hypothetical protein